MRRIAYFVLIAFIASLVLIPASTSKPQAATTLNNIALCYHGIVTNETDKSEYMVYFEEFKAQINYLKNKGYTFVSPSKYNQWYIKKYNPSTPIATVIFDDARESVSIASSWLIQNKIPFGIAVIGKKMEKIEAQEGYMNWATLKSIYNTGYCEILNHTYNMHHFSLKSENGTISSAPILEGPCYIDNGEFIYINKGDLRWYWDLSFVEGSTWSFPLFGTDTATGKPIVSTVKFKAKNSVTVNKVRLWASLHSPYSSGYNANVKIDINGTEVGNKIINTTQYATRSQWPEKEFVTITFDKTYEIEANKEYTMTFTTQNAGNSIFRIYSLPNFSGDYELSSTCTGMTYPGQQKWPAQACIILAGETGKQVTETEFQTYVYADLNMNNNVIKKYLSANWEAISTGYTNNETLECLVIGGTYTDGSRADTNIKFTPNKSFTGEVLRIKNVSHMGNWYPLIIDVYINNQKVSSFSPNWKDWSWQTIDISPYKFVKGTEYNINFKTVNKSISGCGLIRIYIDQQSLPYPTWDQTTNTWIKPSEAQLQYKMQYEVSLPEGTDVYPRGLNIDSANYSWIFSTPYTGPGKAFLEILSCIPGASITPTQICYPFGAYYSQQTGVKEDINPILKNIFKQIRINSGYAVWDEVLRSATNIQSEYSEYLIPRYLVIGNIPQTQIIQDINTLIGTN